MEVRWTFQVDGDEEYSQFAVRAFKRNGVLMFAADLLGQDGPVEGIAQVVIDAVKSALESVQGRVNEDELDEQTS